MNSLKIENTIINEAIILITITMIHNWIYLRHNVLVMETNKKSLILKVYELTSEVKDLVDSKHYL